MGVGRRAREPPTDDAGAHRTCATGLPRRLVGATVLPRLGLFGSSARRVPPGLRM
jgi:hypothetical protein